MKYISTCFAVLILTLSACKKENKNCDNKSSLDGKWRMTKVTDIATGIIANKPASVQKDVDIEFTSISSTEGNITGNTPTNTISAGKFITGTNQSLNIPGFGMTQVMETSWGQIFLDNIFESRSYTIEENNKLYIKTTSSILSFQKQ